MALIKEGINPLGFIRVQSNFDEGLPLGVSKSDLTVDFPNDSALAFCADHLRMYRTVRGKK